MLGITVLTSPNTGCLTLEKSCKLPKRVRSVLERADHMEKKPKPDGERDPAPHTILQQLGGLVNFGIRAIAFGLQVGRIVNPSYNSRQSTQSSDAWYGNHAYRSFQMRLP